MCSIYSAGLGLALPLIALSARRTRVHGLQVLCSVHAFELFEVGLFNGARHLLGQLLRGRVRESPRCSDHSMERRRMVRVPYCSVSEWCTKPCGSSNRALLRTLLLTDAPAEVCSSLLLSATTKGHCNAGDCHPGNVLLLPDGRLGLIDYGQVKAMSTEQRIVYGPILML